jgi:hypothetical protein
MPAELTDADRATPRRAAARDDRRRPLPVQAPECLRMTSEHSDMITLRAIVSRSSSGEVCSR